MTRVQARPRARVAPARFAAEGSAESVRGKRRGRIRGHGPAICAERLIAAARRWRAARRAEHFGFREIIARRAFRAEGRGEAHGAFVEACDEEREVIHHRDPARSRLDDAHFLRLRARVPVRIAPRESCLLLVGRVFVLGLRAFRPKRAEFRPAQQRPRMCAAERGDELRGLRAIAPDERDVVAAGRIVGVAAREIPLPLLRVGVERRVRRVVAGVRFEQRIGPVENARQRVRARFPIEAELQSLVEKARGVLRIEHAAAAVFRGAVEGAHEFTFRRPDGDAARGVVRFGDPEPALRIEREAVRIVEVQRIIWPDGGRTRLADHTERFARGRKDFHLMRSAAVADVEIPRRIRDDVPRIFESTRDDRLCFAQLRFRRGEAQQPFPAQHQQPALRVEGDAARIFHRRATGDGARLRIDEDQFILPHQRTDEHAIARGDAAEDEVALATVEAFEFFRGRLLWLVAELALVDRLVFELRGLGREPQFALPNGADIAQMLRDGRAAAVHGERRRARPVAAHPALPADFRRVLAQPLQPMSTLGNLRAHEDERLPVRRARARHEGHARGRRVIRHPAARLVRRLPRGLAGAIDAHLVAQRHRLAPKAAHLVAAGRDGPRRDIIDAVPRRRGIAQEIVAAIPPRGVFPGGKRRLADEVSHALVFRVLNDERDEARLGQMKLDRNRRRLLDGFRQHERSQRRVAQRRKREHFAEPHAATFLHLVREMRVPRLRPARDPQPHRARFHHRRKTQPMHAERQRIKRIHVALLGDAFPFRGGGFTHIFIRCAGESLDLHGLKANPEQRQSAQPHRGRPSQRHEFGMLRRDRQGRAFLAIVPRAPHPVVRFIDEFRRRIVARDRLRERLRRDIAEPFFQDANAAEPARHFAITRRGIVAETERSRLRASGQNPNGITVFPHLRAGGCGAHESLRRQPLRIVREISGIRRARLEHAQFPAAPRQHRADRDRLGKPDAQMPRRQLAPFAKLHPAPLGPAVLRPSHVLRPAFRRRFRDGGLRARDPLRKRRLVEQCSAERRRRGSG